MKKYFLKYQNSIFLCYFICISIIGIGLIDTVKIGTYLPVEMFLIFCTYLNFRLSVSQTTKDANLLFALLMTLIIFILTRFSKYQSTEIGLVIIIYLTFLLMNLH